MGKFILKKNQQMVAGFPVNKFLPRNEYLPPSIGGSITGGTSGSVLFVNPANTIAQDNANFFWDNTNKRLGIGTASPIDKFDVTGVGKAVITTNGALNIYGTLYTDASNYARGVFRLNGNEFQIVTEKAGSPTARDISIVADTGRALYFGSNGTSYRAYLASSGQFGFAANGLASNAMIYGYGTWFSGGTSTTTKPYMLIEPAGTGSTTWGTSGTGLGINAASGFVGNVIDAKVNNGTSHMTLNHLGILRSKNDGGVLKQVINWDDAIPKENTYSGKTLSIQGINDFFYGYASRWTVADTYTGAYPASGSTWVRTITIPTDESSGGITYPAADLYFGFWVNYPPASISVRIKNKSGTWFGPYTTSTNLNAGGSFGWFKISIGGVTNYVDTYEVTFTPQAGLGVNLQTIEGYLGTPDGLSSPTPIVSKTGTDYLYGRTIWKTGGVTRHDINGTGQYAGFTTRGGQHSVGFIDTSYNSGFRTLALATGKTYLDGWSDGAAKNQNYDIVIGSRVNNLLVAITGNTTAEVGSNVQIGFETSTIPSAVLALNTVTRGFLPPRQTTVQRDAIASPAAGIMVYNTTTNKMNFYNGSAWEQITSV